MIQTIINNFQSITEAKIKIEGVTLLIGESNQGKSACLRALQAACTNRFRGGMVRYGEEQALIRIKTPESPEILSVARMWDGGSPKMKLGNKMFTKLGRTLPKEVDEFLNLGFYDLNGDIYSCNFHNQFQKPLLLEYSQKKVMELLSASTALDDLKLVKEQVLLDRQANKGAIATVDTIIADTRKDLAEVSERITACADLIQDFVSRVEQLEQLNLKQEKLQSFQKSTMLHGRLVLQETILKLTIKSTKVTQLLDLVRDLSQLSKKESLYQRFREVYNQDLMTKVNSLTVFSELHESFNNLKSKETGLTNKNVLYKRGQELSSQFLDLRLKTQSLAEFSSRYTLFESIKSKETELKRIVEENICPICGNKISNGLQ